MRTGSFPGDRFAVAAIALDTAGLPPVAAFFRRRHLTHLAIYLDPEHRTIRADGGAASVHWGLRLPLAAGAAVSCGFWLVTRLRHRAIAGARDAVPALAAQPAAIQAAERGA